MKKNKHAGNPNWGGARQESMMIKKRADQWCRDNGYPIQERRYVYKKLYNRNYEKK
tara:strand:+ start:261 stop:428 length:168 start_codon:yes stop_codon:yes gene_type:complete